MVPVQNSPEDVGIKRMTANVSLFYIQLVFCLRLTFVHDGDGFLSNSRARSPDCFCVQIKLVARAVLEVGQSDRGLIGGQSQLLPRAQLIGAVD